MEAVESAVSSDTKGRDIPVIPVIIEKTIVEPVVKHLAPNNHHCFCVREDGSDTNDGQLDDPKFALRTIEMALAKAKPQDRIVVEAKVLTDLLARLKKERILANVAATIRGNTISAASDRKHIIPEDVVGRAPRRT